MNFIDIRDYTVTNPETGEEFQRARVVTDDKQEFPIMGTIDEVKEFIGKHGNDTFDHIRIADTDYGKVAVMRRSIDNGSLM